MFKTYTHIEQAIDDSGGVRALARLLKLSEPTVSNWKRTRIPAHHCLAVSKISGVKLHDLRPDVYQEHMECS